MHMGYNNMQSDYVMDRNKLYCVTVKEKDLGVMISEGWKTWKWKKQCSGAVSRDNKMGCTIK